MKVYQKVEATKRLAQAAGQDSKKIIYLAINR